MPRLSNARFGTKLSNVQIGTKLAVMSGLGIVLVAGMIASQILASTTIRSVLGNSSANLVNARNLETIEAAERGMQVALGNIRFADGGTDLQNASKLLAKRQKTVDVLLDPMIAKSAGGERIELSALKGLIDNYAAAGRTIVTLQLKAMSASGTHVASKASTEAQSKFKQLNAMAQGIEGAIAGTIGRANLRAKTGFAAVDQSITSSNRLAIGIGLLAALVMVGSVVFGAVSIARPLRALVHPLEKVAGGNFAIDVPGRHRQDEVGQIAGAVATMAEKVSATIAGIKTAGRDVTSASAEIATSTTDLSQRTEEQAASLEETSAAMEELSSTVKKNAENAQHANESANSTMGVADRGSAVVAQAVQAMAKIEDSSRKISDIIGVIDEIARQTNLLALNAAVEAARAGEAGRGFAVVAQEVRSLAQRSSQAAKDITDLITSSNDNVKDGVGLVNRAGASLNEIVESIKGVASIVAEIANASAEQATGIEQINRALTQMDEATQQNSALVEENAATAKTLEDQAKAMDEQVAYFKIANSDFLEVAARHQSVEYPTSKAQTLPHLMHPAKTAVHAKRIEPAKVVGKANVPAKQVVAGGPVGRMQTALAAAVIEDGDWKEF